MQVKFISSVLIFWLIYQSSSAQTFKNPIHIEELLDDTLYNAGIPSMYKPDLVDIDNDEDLDLLYGCNDTVIVFHENIGTAYKSKFAPFDTNPFGISGEKAMAPRFIDIDGDGDYDLISSVYDNGDLYFYENIGSANHPAFKKPVINPFGFTPSNDWDYSSNAIDFADIDGDGDEDLLIVEYEGRMLYYENLGSTNQADFSQISINPFGLDPALKSEFLYETCEGTPAFSDVDNDGDFDLFVGTWDNDILYFENTGTKCFPQFKPSSQNHFDIVIPEGFLMNRESPAFGDIDGDGDEDLVVGFSQHPSFYYFEFEGIIPKPNTHIENVLLCSGSDYTFPDGTKMTNIKTNTTYISQLESSTGCDSLITTYISIHVVDVSIAVTDDTLTAINTGAESYQWISCSQFLPVDEAVSQMFIPESPGEYAVVIQDSCCVDTSTCFVLEQTSVLEVETFKDKIWPNPTSGKIHIHFADSFVENTISVINQEGELLAVYIIPTNCKTTKLTLPKQPGMYFIKIWNKRQLSTYKIINKQ